MIGSIYGLLGLGYSLIYRASGLMNFSQGDLFMVGAFVGMTFYRTLNLPFFLALLLTMVVMFFVGFFLEKLIIRQILRRSKSSFIILATLAVSLLLKNGAAIIFGSNRQQFPSIFGTDVMINIGGVNIQPESLVVVGVALIAMVLLHLFMTKSSFGTAMRSAAQDPLAAQACGIDVSFTTGVTWGISSAVAAVGGILYGPVYGVSTAIGAVIGQRAFSSAVVGGYGNMYGAILGGLLIGFIETFAAGYISSEYKDFIAFAILLIFLFVKPTGLLNEPAVE